MANKQIPKDLLDEVIAKCSEYWDDGPGSVRWSDVLALCHKLSEVTGIHWNFLSDFLSSIFPSTGLKPDATNEDVYAVLRLLGWEVV